MIDPESVNELVDGAIHHAKANSRDAVALGVDEHLDIGIRNDFAYIVDHIEEYDDDAAIINEIDYTANGYDDTYPVHPTPPVVTHAHDGYNIYMQNHSVVDELSTEHIVQADNITEVLTKSMSGLLRSAGSEYVINFSEYMNDNVNDLAN